MTTYYLRQGGADLELDRFAVLGQPRDWTSDRRLRMIRSEDDALRVGRLLCRELGHGADIRAEVTCATRRGWKRAHSKEDAVCNTR